MRRTQIAIISYILPFTSALSLANFQQISPSAVSLVCLVTYDSPIPGCVVADFQDGAACSTSCIAGLKAINQAVNEACSGIKVSSSTLLGMVFENKMVGALCPNTVSSTTAAPATTQSATVVPPAKSTTSTSVESTSIPSSTSISSTTPVIIKTTSSTSATTESKSSETIRKTTSVAQTTSSISTTSSSEATLTASITSSVASSLAFDTATTPSANPTPTFTSNKMAPTHQSHKSAQQIQIEASRDTGGGSPFDIVDSSGPIQIPRGDFRLLFICFSVMLGLLIGL